MNEYYIEGSYTVYVKGRVKAKSESQALKKFKDRHAGKLTVKKSNFDEYPAIHQY